jgi:hypothetical protein
MPLSQDITLDGLPYTVVPGSYRKSNAPAAAGELPKEVKRLVLGPFARGQRQALDSSTARPLDSSTRPSAGWDSAGVGPCFDGQGVEPWPNATSFADANLLDLPSATQRAHPALGNGQGLIGIGRRVYKPAPYGSAWTSMFSVDLGAGVSVSGVTFHQGGMLILCGQSADVRRFNMSTNAVSVWRTGEKATFGVSYKDQLVYAPLAPGAETEIRLSGVRWNAAAVTHVRYVDTPVRNMALFNGKVAIATRTSLWLLGGEPYPGEPDDASVPADTSKAPAWLGDPEPVMSHGIWAADDDFVFLTSYRGKLFTWLQGRVAEFDDSQEQGRWLRQGPEGVACYGGCVAGDHLFVAIESRYDGRRELWAFDGAGWWLVESAGSGNPRRLWPSPIGGAGDRDLLLFRDGSATYDLYRGKWRSSTLHTYAPSGEWTSSLLDAGDPTRDKAWRACGAVFAAPAQRGNGASVDQVSVALEYSGDGGATWLQAAAVGTAAAGQRLRTLQAGLASPLLARHLQLRVRWSSVLDWAPVLTHLWAEYAPLDNAPPRRRWELTIAASDRKIARDGQLAPTTGRQDIAALWTAWSGGATLAFRDIDHDTAPVDYLVRIEAIAERPPRPADQARWGESQVELTLVEV